MTTSNQVQLTITAQAVATGSYYNTATITGWPPGVTDPNPSNDTASVSVVVTPPLGAKILRQGSLLSLVISWPTNLGLALQQNTNLSGPYWTAVTNMHTVSNGQYQVILSPTNKQDFFRLIPSP